MSRILQPFLIAVGLALGLAVTHGIGIHAFGLIWPAMQAELGLSSTNGGLLASACAAGFAVGLALTGSALRVVGPARMFQVGLLTASAALLATGATRDLAHLAVLRAIAGLAAAPMLLGGAALASAILVYEPERARSLLAVFHGGTAVGMILAGAVLPPMLANLGTRGWPEVWLTIGLVAVASLPFAFWACQHVAVPAPRRVRSEWRWTAFLPVFVANALFGAGALILLTFLIPYAVLRGANLFAVVAIWTTLGLAGLLAQAFWLPLLARLSAAQRVAAPIAMTLAATLVALFDGPVSILVVVAAMIGFGVFMVPATISLLIEEALPREAWPSAYRVFCCVHATGQIAGPLAAGWLTDSVGSMHAGLGLAAGLLAMAALVALVQVVPTARAAAPTPARRPLGQS